jgi:hypothetical protein
MSRAFEQLKDAQSKQKNDEEIKAQVKLIQLFD